MSVADLLRPGLLEGASILTAGGREDAAVGDACTRLGATVAAWAPTDDDLLLDEGAVEALVSEMLRRAPNPCLLAVETDAMFGSGGRPALVDSMQLVWNLARATANATFLPREQGRIALIAPAPHVGEHADAARAGMENLARTLSIEWARHGVTVVTIAPGERTTAEEVGTLVAYLASPAGSYFSGCLLDLRGV